MTPKMERWKNVKEKAEEEEDRQRSWQSLREKAEEEEGRYDPQDGGIEEPNGEG